MTSIRPHHTGTPPQPNKALEATPLRFVLHFERSAKEMKLAVMHQTDPIASDLHLRFSDQSFNTPDEAAAHFGLTPIGENWRTVERAHAFAILCYLLSEDMAFSSPRIPKEIAEAEADEFLSRFSSGARFYTNGNWEDGWTKSRFGRSSFGPSWHPATKATFDGGILVVDTVSSGVLWLEDED